MRVPPGRAGQLWLRRRIAVAERGLDVLRRKQHLLHEERDRRAGALDAGSGQWEEACAAAELWMRRALDAAGHQQMPLIAGDAEPAAVDVAWAQVMSVHLPASVRVTVPPSLVIRTAALGGSAAFDRAAEHAAVAVQAGVTVAAATAALAALDGELASTARRIRLLQRRRLPELRTALDESTRRLEESERNDGVLARWAARRSREVVNSR